MAQSTLDGRRQVFRRYYTSIAPPSRLVVHFVVQPEPLGTPGPPVTEL